MSISIRKSFRWLPDPATEPTSTLVLTSSEHSYYVDVRVLDGAVPPQPPDVALDATESASSPSSKSVRSLDEIDWAFAGTSSRLADATTPRRWKAKWVHWVDSRTTRPEEVRDEAIVDESGPDETTEVGQMINPTGSLMQDYEEIWRDLPAGSQHDSSSMVLVAEDTTSDTRGMMIRIGPWCQGVLRQGTLFTCSRWWSRSVNDDAGNDDWRCVLQVGDAELLPCRLLWSRKDFAVGERTAVNGIVWQCKERSNY